MNDIIKLPLSLFIISSLAGFAIGLTNSKTMSRIKEQELLARQEALDAVLPDADTVITVEGTSRLPKKYWKAEKDGKIAAYAFEVKSRGYSSDLEFMIGVGPDGKIIGIKIMKQSETPGLGTRIEETVSKNYIWNGLFKRAEKTEPWFTNQFKGIDVFTDVAISKAAEWHTLDDNGRKDLLDKNAISAITGATISTEAVRNGLSRIVRSHMKNIGQE